MKDKPLVPHQCAVKECAEVIYPSDEKFYRDLDGFWYCGWPHLFQMCRRQAFEKALIVQEKWATIARIRQELGL